MAETIQPHILVVDDDPQIRELLDEYLTENALRVSVVSNGKRPPQESRRTLMRPATFCRRAANETSEVPPFLQGARPQRVTLHLSKPADRP